MWRCVCGKTGREFHIFSHRDETKDNTQLWRDKKPYVWSVLSAMSLYDEIDCTNDPLAVELLKEGYFWKVKNVLAPVHGWEEIIVERPYASGEDEGEEIDDEDSD